MADREESRRIHSECGFFGFLIRFFFLIVIKKEKEKGNKEEEIRFLD